MEKYVASRLIATTILILMIGDPHLVLAQSGFEPAYSAIVLIKSADQSSGTGIVIGKTQNELLILTNRHVVWSSELGKSGIFEEDLRKRTKVLFNTKQLGSVSQIRYDKTTGALDVAVLYVKVDHEPNIKTLALSGIANRRGSNAWVVGYPAGKLSPAIFQAEINNEDSRNYDFSLKRALKGGESGSALLDARGNIMGIVTRAERRENNSAIKSTAIRRTLAGWNIEIMTPTESPIVAFPTIISKIGNKNLQQVANRIYERMISYTQDLPQVSVVSAETARYLLDLIKENRPGFMVGELAFYLPTQRLDAILEKEKEGYIVRFELRSIPDDGRLPISFSARGKGVETLAENAIKALAKQLSKEFANQFSKEFANQFSLGVEFHGIRHSWRRRSLIFSIVGAGASAVMVSLASDKRQNYENALTGRDAEDRFTTLHRTQIARNSFMTATAVSFGFWFNAKFLNPRKAVFDNEKVKYVTSK